jgi:hypothetical protein
MKITYIKDWEVVTKEIPTPVGMPTLNQEWLRNELNARNIHLHRVVKISDLPDSLTSIGASAFFGCSELIAITLPPKLTSIGASAFHGCSGLTAIALPEGLTSIGDYAFYGCSELIAITLPPKLTSIGASAFEGCSGLTAIALPKSLTSIGARAFGDCSGLTAIALPKSLTSIGARAFGDCSGLTSITLPEGLTSIDDKAFCRCTGLTSITLPEGLKDIGENAFHGCTHLKYILAPVSLEIDTANAGISEDTKIIRYDASVHANPITAVQALYQSIIKECGYTDPDKQKQVQQHLVEGFLKPKVLLKSALKSLSPLITSKSSIEPMNTIRDYLKESCEILKGEAATRQVTYAQVQKALNDLVHDALALKKQAVAGPHFVKRVSVEKHSSLPQYLLESHILPMLSPELSILMDPKPDIDSVWADLTSVASEKNSPDVDCAGGGGGSKPAP